MVDMSAVELRYEAVECLKRVLILETEARALRERAVAATNEANHLEAGTLSSAVSLYLGRVPRR
jgi:hypothetical protein